MLLQIPREARITASQPCNYRYPEKGARVILDANKKFHAEYNSAIEEYLKLSQAPENLKNNFTADTMIKIKNVSYKVRDLGIIYYEREDTALYKECLLYKIAQKLEL